MRAALLAGAVRDLFVEEGAGFAAEFVESGAVLVSGQVMAALSDTATPQGVVAVAEAPAIAAEDVHGDLVLVLAGVRDPGNAGTLLRSAAAAGAAAVAFPEGSVDPFNPKTVRATAGLLFRVPVIVDASLQRLLAALRAKGFVVIGADAGAPVTFDEIDLRGAVALVVGNEAWGIDASARAMLDEIVSIPMPGAAESLNAGIAGSILLFEAVRQRRAEK